MLSPIKVLKKIDPDRREFLANLGQTVLGSYLLGGTLSDALLLGGKQKATLEVLKKPPADTPTVNIEVRDTPTIAIASLPSLYERGIAQKYIAERSSTEEHYCPHCSDPANQPDLDNSEGSGVIVQHKGETIGLSAEHVLRNGFTKAEEQERKFDLLRDIAAVNLNQTDRVTVSGDVTTLSAPNRVTDENLAGREVTFCGLGRQLYRITGTAYLLPFETESGEVVNRFGLISPYQGDEWMNFRGISGAPVQDTTTGELAGIFNAAPDGFSFDTWILPNNYRFLTFCGPGTINATLRSLEWQA